MKSLFGRFLCFVLSLFGFSSCFFSAMYGTPHVDFKASGTVKDEEGKPLEGIRVAVQQHRHFDNSPGVIYDTNDWYENDTLYTDSAGKYLLERSPFNGPNEVKIVFEDIDGPDNGGEFEPTEASPAVVQTKKGDNNWYGGAYEVSADVTLRKK